MVVAKYSYKSWWARFARQSNPIREKTASLNVFRLSEQWRNQFNITQTYPKVQNYVKFPELTSFQLPEATYNYECPN